MADILKIGLFDSGIGGVTVLKEILKLFPNKNYIYYSDSKNNPYGNKTKDEIIDISKKIVKVLIKKGAKVIVIACNTASAQAADVLRKEYHDIPILAIEPAYKMVHDFAPNDGTLVMATKGTTESDHFMKLIEKYDNHKTYILPCIGLANAIENNDSKKIYEYLNQVLVQYKGKVKNVVLGCTHYPLIEDKIKEVLGDVRIFNGAPSLAVHLKEVLQSKNMIDNDITKDKIENENCSIEDMKKQIEFIDSSNAEYKERRFFELLSSYKTVQ